MDSVSPFGAFGSDIREEVEIEMKKLYMIQAMTPVHIGTGTGIGFIDLPVMRETTTGWPVAPGSGIKGVLADKYQAADAGKRTGALKAAFGGGVVENSTAGSLVFGDARLVCLPVRSLYGTFAWATSALALRRFLGDLKLTGKDADAPNIVVPDPGKALVTASTVLKSTDGNLYLQDLDLLAEASPQATQWAVKLAALLWATGDEWIDEFKKRFTILPDDVFDFLCETGMEVVARIRIDSETKIVANGQLWYEESWPAETVMTGVVWCDKVLGNFPGVPPGTLTPETLMAAYCSGETPLQIGGKATTGKGRVRMRFV